MKPIIQFYHNLKRDGIDITHDGQRLNVTINNSALKDNPYIKDEIRKRANLLAQLLDLSNVPEELHEHIMQPLPAGLADTVLYMCKCTGHLVRPYTIGNDTYLEYVGGLNGARQNSRTASGPGVAIAEGRNKRLHSNSTGQQAQAKA